jgi:hypothetical protein
MLMGSALAVRVLGTQVGCNLGLPSISVGEELLLVVSDRLCQSQYTLWS